MGWNKTFDYSTIPLGYYDQIAARRKGMRSFWHYLKFRRIVDGIDQPAGSILDIGCFAGTFLGMVPPDLVAGQTGVDILPEQIGYARQKYGTDYRKFYEIKNLNDLNFIPDQSLDYITSIEVIEHLTRDEILELFDFTFRKLKPGGKLILTTPNYFSAWPFLEVILDLVSKVKYEEQHVTRFNYFNLERKFSEIYQAFGSQFFIDVKTTTHFFTPLIAMFSFRIAEKAARLITHRHWRLPLGSLLLIQILRK
jgi:2-polyprenyl-3-methyl-5-hydroxy-6-metoxy-1,4-benzoquinol methylase